MMDASGLTKAGREGSLAEGRSSRRARLAMCSMVSSAGRLRSPSSSSSCVRRHGQSPTLEEEEEGHLSDLLYPESELEFVPGGKQLR